MWSFAVFYRSWSMTSLNACLQNVTAWLTLHHSYTPLILHDILHHCYCVTHIHHCYCMNHTASLLLRDSYCINVTAWLKVHHTYCMTHTVSLLLRDSYCISYCVTHSVPLLLYDSYCSIVTAWLILHHTGRNNISVEHNKWEKLTGVSVN